MLIGYVVCFRVQHIDTLTRLENRVTAKRKDKTEKYPRAKKPRFCLIVV